MIYFIQKQAGPIKVGYSANVSSRLQTLQTGSPESLTLLAQLSGNRTLERYIHNKFAHLKLEGEWFKPERELLAYIDELKASGVTAPEEQKDKIICLPNLSRIMVFMGQNIKLARKRRKLTASQVAERAGITRVTLRRVENGEAGVAFGNIANVLFTLGLEKDLELVGKDDVFGRKLQDVELLSNKNKKA